MQESNLAMDIAEIANDRQQMWTNLQNFLLTLWPIWVDGLAYICSNIRAEKFCLQNKYTFQPHIILTVKYHWKQKSTLKI